MWSSGVFGPFSDEEDDVDVVRHSLEEHFAVVLYNLLSLGGSERADERCREKVSEGGPQGREKEGASSPSTVGSSFIAELVSLESCERESERVHVQRFSTLGSRTRTPNLHEIFPSYLSFGAPSRVSSSCPSPTKTERQQQSDLASRRPQRTGAGTGTGTCAHLEHLDLVFHVHPGRKCEVGVGREEEGPSSASGERVSFRRVQHSTSSPFFASRTYNHQHTSTDEKSVLSRRCNLRPPSSAAPSSPTATSSPSTTSPAASSSSTSPRRGPVGPLPLAAHVGTVLDVRVLVNHRRLSPSTRDRDRLLLLLLVVRPVLLVRRRLPGFALRRSLERGADRDVDLRVLAGDERTGGSVRIGGRR